MVCSLCGLSYGGTQHKGATWYRCGGKRRDRGASESTCPGRRIKGDDIEPLVWQDVERFLRDPSDLITELDASRDRTSETAKRERDLEAIEVRLADLSEQRKRAHGLAVRGAMTDDELDAELARIEADRADVERHRASTAPIEPDDTPDVDLLAELRTRLDAGLNDAQRQEIVGLLVGRLLITTTIADDGTKEASAVISYRFEGALGTRTGNRVGDTKTVASPDRAKGGTTRGSPRRHCRPMTSSVQPSDGERSAAGGGVGQAKNSMMAAVSSAKAQRSVTLPSFT